MNIAFIMGSSLLGRVLNLLLHAALARVFGPVGLGGYATAVAVAGYFVFAADFGLSPRLTREGAIAPQRLAEEYAGALGLKLITGVAAFLALAVICHVLPYEFEVRALCFLLGCSAIIRSFSYLNESVCRARERLDLEGISSLLGTASFVCLGLLLIALDYPVRAVGIAAIGANCLQLLLSAIFARRFIPLGLRLPPRWQIARAALPYATTSLTLLAFAQIDVLLISLIETQEFVGRFASLSRLLLIAGTVGALAAGAILPTASRLYVSSSVERFQQLVNECVRGVLMLSGLVMLGVVVVAKSMIVAIYGDAFSDLAPLLQAGSVYLVFKLTVSILAMMLTATGRQGARARSMLVGLAATVVLVLSLVPLFGIGGAVAAMIGSEFILAGCLSFCLSETLTWGRHLRTLASATLASVGGVSLYLWLSQQVGVGWSVASVALPLLLYAAIGLATGEGVRTIRFVASLRERT